MPSENISMATVVDGFKTSLCSSFSLAKQKPGQWQCSAIRLSGCHDVSNQTDRFFLPAYPTASVSYCYNLCSFQNKNIKGGK